MGTISDKLTYLNTTKTQLKQMISYGYPLSNETFRQYVGGVFQALINSMSDTKNITWQNLPKITTTPSTSQSINNTIEAPMRIELSPSELSQDSTPTPSSPQAVHTITGENTIKVVGKNLFDYTTTTFSNDKVNITTENNAIIMTTNVEATSGNLFFMTKIPDEYLENGASYTISSENVSGVVQKLKLQLRNHDGTNANKSQADTVIYDSNYSLYVVRNIYASNNETTIPVGTTAIIKNVQVEKGTTASEYEPYKENSYEVNLGVENLLNNTATSQTTNGVQFSVNEDKSVYVSGTASATAYLEYQTFSLKAGTYTLSAGVYVNSLTRIQLVEDITGRPMITSTSSASSTTFTINEDKNVFLQFRINSGEVINTTFYPQLEKGSIAHTYTEYGKQIEYCKIGNYEDEFIRTSGKNLFNSNNVESGTFYSTSDGSITSSSVWSQSEYISVNGGEKISISSGYSTINNSYEISQFNSSKQWLQGEQFSLGTSKTYTLNANTKYIKIGYRNDRDTTNSLQVEKSNTATTYEPYGKNEWWVKKAIGRIILDGSENWTITNSGASNWYYNYNSNYIPIHNVQSTDYGKCSHYVPTTIGNSDLGQGISLLVNGVLRIKYGTEDTITNFKTWLSSNNVSLYYVLATPTYTKLDNEELIEQLNKVKNSQSQEGTTNILQLNTDLAFVISASALLDLSEEE